MRHRNSCTSNINSLPRRDPFASIVLAPFSRLIFTLKPSFPLPVVINQETVKVRSQASQTRNHKLHCNWTTCKTGNRKVILGTRNVLFHFVTIWVRMDTIGKIELNPSFVLSSDNTNYKNGHSIVSPAV